VTDTSRFEWDEGDMEITKEDEQKKPTAKSITAPLGAPPPRTL